MKRFVAVKAGMVAVLMIVGMAVGVVGQSIPNTTVPLAAVTWDNRPEADNTNNGSQNIALNGGAGFTDATVEIARVVRTSGTGRFDVTSEDYFTVTDDRANGEDDIAAGANATNLVVAHASTAPAGTYEIHFYVDHNTSQKTMITGMVTYTIRPAEVGDFIFTLGSVPFVGAPVSTEIVDHDQFTGTVVWTTPSLTDDDFFRAATAHTARVDLVAKPGYIFRPRAIAGGDTTGTTTNSFTITNMGNAEVTYNHVSDANGSRNFSITLAFPATHPAGVVSSRAFTIVSPATGRAPIDTIITTSQFTGTIEWSPAVATGGVFAPETEYTATVTMTPRTPAHTFTGTAGAFSVTTRDWGTTTDYAPNASGNKAEEVTYVNGTNVVTVAFEETVGLEKIEADLKDDSGDDAYDLLGITLPRAGERPVRVIEPVIGTKAGFEDDTLYTGTVTWTPELDANGRFVSGVAYTAHITLTAGTRFTFEGVSANTFVIDGAVPNAVLNPPGTGRNLVVTALFHVSNDAQLTMGASGADAINIGVLATAGYAFAPNITSLVATWFETTVSDDVRYTGTIDWSPELVGGRFIAGTDYTATIKLAARPGYTFAGIPANSVRIEGFTSNAANGQINAGPTHPSWVAVGTNLWEVNAALNGQTIHPAGTGPNLTLTTVFRTLAAGTAPVFSFLDEDGKRESADPADVYYTGSVITEAASTITLDFETDNIPMGAYVVTLLDGTGNALPVAEPEDIGNNISVQGGGLFVGADGKGTVTLNIANGLDAAATPTIRVQISVPKADGTGTDDVFAAFVLGIVEWVAVTAIGFDDSEKDGESVYNFARFPLNLADFAEEMVDITGGGVAFSEEDITWRVINAPATGTAGEIIFERLQERIDADFTDVTGANFRRANLVGTGSGTATVSITTNDDGEQILNLGSAVALGTLASNHADYQSGLGNRRFIALQANIAGAAVGANAQPAVAAGVRGTKADTIFIEITTALLGGKSYDDLTSSEGIAEVTGFGFKEIEVTRIAGISGTFTVTLPTVAELNAKIGGSPTYVTEQTGTSTGGLPAVVDGAIVEPRRVRVVPAYEGSDLNGMITSTVVTSAGVLTLGVDANFVAADAFTVEIPVTSPRVDQTDATRGSIEVTVNFVAADDAKEDAPVATDLEIDYVTERIGGLIAGRQYRVEVGTQNAADRDIVTATTAGEIAINPNWIPATSTQNIKLELLGRDDDWLISDQSGNIAISARPAAPDVYEREISGTEGIISGLLVEQDDGEPIAMEYRLRAATSWTPVTMAALVNHELTVPHGVYEVRFAAIAADADATPAVAGSFASEATTLVIGGETMTETQPDVNNFVINFTTERLGGLVASRTYRVLVGSATTSSNVTTDAQGTVAIATGWLGESIRLILAGSGDVEDSPASLPFAIPARPAAPAIAGEDINNDDPEDIIPGKLTGLSTAMEYRLLPETSWTRVTSAMIVGGEMEVTEAGMYQVRTVVTASAFVSSTVEVEIDFTTTISIAEVGREDPVGGTDDVAVVAPVRAPAKFVVGPSPVSIGGAVKFYGASSGTLRIFDALGNVVRDVSVASGWDLRDSGGRLVSEGTYVARGIVIVNGERVRVSVPVTVVK
ncbi:MAG: hypothetical protein LBU70_10295 [Chitinispirillales bacterium]|nr:hypothetical protein [Chitinispirillales bacterium]